MANYYDLVKGPKAPTGLGRSTGYVPAWEDVERAGLGAPSSTRTGAVAVATDIITDTAHGLVNGQGIVLYSLSTVTGVSVGVTYYVIGATANTFQIALTPGGAAINMGGSDGNVTYALAPRAIVGTPITPEHFFDPRDGAVTAQPVLST